MADALDLRHRHLELWQLIITGAVPSWKARKVAQATRHVSRSSALQVDAAVARVITGLPWARFETLLTAKIIEADPHAAEQQATIWEAERFVRTGRCNQAGPKLLIAKANAGNVILFMATINRIAEILRLHGNLARQLQQPEPGVWLWRPPHGALYLVTNAGPHTPGDGPFARQLWRAATPAKQRAPAEPG
jgi:hypothetical protein